MIAEVKFKVKPSGTVYSLINSMPIFLIKFYFKCFEHAIGVPLEIKYILRFSAFKVIKLVKLSNNKKFNK